MEINGIEGLTKADIQNEIARGGKFVRFNYCISIIILSFRQVSDVYFIRAGESAFQKGLASTFLSLFFGWWGIPMGIIWTIEALAINLGGGKNVTEEVLSVLNISMATPDSASISKQKLSEQLSQYSKKSCPECGEEIKLEALFCRFCGHQFDEEEMQFAVRMAGEKVERAKELTLARELESQQTSQREAERKKSESKLKRDHGMGLALTIIGGIMGFFGALLLLLFIGAAIWGDTAAQDITDILLTFLCCPLPLFIIGGGLLWGGITMIRQKKKAKSGSTEGDVSKFPIEETPTSAINIPETMDQTKTRRSLNEDYNKKEKNE